MSKAAKFDSDFYISENQDVAEAIFNGSLESPIKHFELFGARESRAPNEFFSPSFYSEKNSDVAIAVDNAVFENSFHHYKTFGEQENRAPSPDFEGFNQSSYLFENADVAFAVSVGIFQSALDHFISFGHFESRLGHGITSKSFSLTASSDDFRGSFGNDSFFGSLSTISAEDKIDGAGGNDSLEVSINSANLGELSLPSSQNIFDLEEIILQFDDTPAVSADDQLISFLSYSSVKNIKMVGGSTIDGASLVVDLKEDQSLHLLNFEDGDAETNLLEDGGLKISHSLGVKTFNLSIEGVGKSEPSASREFVLQLDNSKLEEINLTVGGNNTLLIRDTVDQSARINLIGSGTTNLGVLPSSIFDLYAVSSAAHLTFIIENSNVNATTGTGNDAISVAGGQSSISTGDGNDVVNLLGGQAQVNTQNGGDDVTISGGSQNVDTGTGEDIVSVSDGTTSLSTGADNDVVDISGGLNTLNTGFGDDTVSLSGGNNTINSGSGNDTISIISGENIINAGEGDDIITASGGINELDGGPGNDRLSIISSGVVTLPITDNVESFFISDTVHQSLDFTFSASLNSIELDSGTTVDNATINTVLGSGQSLTLDSITDGDTAAASLSDGGIKISQANSITALNLTLDDIGPASAITNSNLFIDIAGQAVTTANITSANDSFIVLENSGAVLNKLNLTGSGTLGIIGMLANSITIIDGGSSTANLTFTTGLGNDTIATGTGNDIITLTGGTNSVTSGDGNDTVNLSSGSDSVTTGSGDDNVVAGSGNNNINTGADDDQVNLTGGTNDLSTGTGNDQVTVSGGNNTINTDTGNDQITISGGTNTIASGDGADILSLSAGTSNISTGSGDDTITASGGASNVDIRSLDGGAGTDRLNIISTGTVTLPTATNIETFFISDTVHQSLDFSFSTSLNGIELDSGTTIDNSTITLTLGAGQALTLDSITDGDTSAASLLDGGISIAQAPSLTSLDLTLDDVGPSTSTTNENVFIDIAGTGVTTAKVTSGNDSFVVISNTGGNLTGIELLGTGTIALGTLPTSITNVNGAAATANLTLTIGSTGVNTFRGGIGDDAVTLTGGTNDVQTGDGDDIITTTTNLALGDRIDGGNGTDTFEVIHTGLATIPTTANLFSIERFAIQDTVHQSLDFSALTSITGIELDSGTTVDNATINTVLGSGQSLTLDSITDGDTAAASLSDGGIKISQPNSTTSLDLTLDDIGPAAASTNENVVIDIAGANVSDLNITSANDSFVVLENSGASISTINIAGSGTLSLIGTLPNSITTINGGTSSTSFAVSTGTAGATITGSSSNDVIVLGGGSNNVDSGNGNDTVTLSTGNDTVNTGSGSDTVTASSGTNNISTGASGDQITLSGGTNTVNSGASNDQLTISGGTNNIDTESGNDQITISGGNNTITAGNNNDVISASNGVNNINTGSGNDQVTLTGGTNTIVTGNNNDTINVSGGNNDIDTDAGTDQVVLTGGTNDVNTGANDDTVTLSSGTETVDMGSGNDTVEAGANLSTADTLNGGDGTGDTIEITSALTDALTARLSNFEILEIKGGGGITHDITGLTGLTSLKASGALAGAVVITDLAEAAELDISAAIGNDLTINQINSAGGSDTLTIDLRGGSYTTGGVVIAPNIESVTIQTNQNGSKVLSGGTFADATNIVIAASRGNLTITDLTALNIDTLNFSSSNRTVNVTTGADVFTQAFTFTGGSRNDTLNLDGATLVTGTIYELGNDLDTLTINNDAVANIVRTSATQSNNAFAVRDDATSTDTASFVSGSDTFDYNGALKHASASSVVVSSGASLQAAVAADTDATVYLISDPDGDADFEAALNVFADGVTDGRAQTLNTEAVDTGLLSYTGLDSAFDLSDIVLLAIDTETNEDATLADNGGTAVYQFQNTDTSTVDTVLSSELELIGVFQDVALAAADFI